MRDDAARFDALRPEFQALANEADWLFGAIVEGKGQNLRFPERLVVPTLLAKTRDDFRALGILTWQRCTSASYVIARSLVEETVDLFYLTSGSAEEQHNRSARFLGYALAEEQRISLRREEHVARGNKENPAQVDDEDRARRKAAIQSVRERIQNADEGRFKELVERYVAEFARVPQSWSTVGTEDRWTSIDADATTKRNLDYAVRVFYSVASLFVHSPGCLYYLVDDTSRPDATPLVKGRIRDVHFAPFTVGLLIAMDFMRRCNTLLSADLAGSVDSLARKRRELLDRVLSTG